MRTRRTKKNPLDQTWADEVTEWLQNSEHADLPWIKKFLKRVAKATTETQYKKLHKELVTFLDVLAEGPDSVWLEDERAAQRGPSVDEINQALLMGTLGVADSGLAVTGMPRAPRNVRGAAAQPPAHFAQPVAREPVEDEPVDPGDGLEIWLFVTDEDPESVFVQTNDGPGADSDQSIQGSRWEGNQEDYAYAIISNTPTLPEDLRAEGYHVHARDWRAPPVDTPRRHEPADDAPIADEGAFTEGYINHALLYYAQITGDSSRSQNDLQSHTRIIMHSTCRAFKETHAVLLESLYRDGFTYAELGKCFFMARNRLLGYAMGITGVAEAWPDFHLRDNDGVLSGFSNLVYIRTDRWTPAGNTAEMVEDAELRQFIRGFMEAALLDLEEGGINDAFVIAGDLHWTTLGRAASICYDFYNQNYGNLTELSQVDSWTRQQSGRLLYWNMNGHGSGFWENSPHRETRLDRVADELGSIAQTLGQWSLYRGDDLLIHYMHG